MVAYETRMTVIYWQQRFSFLESVEMLLFNAQISSYLLQFALQVFNTGETIAMMIGHDQLHRRAA
jgi:hypothetical protein